MPLNGPVGPGRVDDEGADVGLGAKLGVADGIPVGITTGISEGVNVGDKLVTAVGVGVPSGDKENRVGAGVLGTR